MLEKQIEAKGNEHAKTRGVASYKFTSPGRAAVPDRLMLAEIPEFLRALIAQYIRFIEYKRKGQKPTPAQSREHARLRAMGFTVDVIDNIPDAVRVIDRMG
jgi:hypothetical protein